MAEASSLPHLRALDGLRAVAVVSVALFHFGVAWLPGGYLGVDIFFVLSGFLITSLLLHEREANGRVQLIPFWRARSRRLFPALAALLSVVAFVAWESGPLMQMTIFQQGLATLAYVNNWWLVVAGGSYFGNLEQASPLIHTWSLGVEEQWYLAFPVVLIASTFAASRLHSPRVLGVLFGLMALLSEAWGTWLAFNGAPVDRLYFGTDVRAQELLVGAALAAFCRPSSWNERPATPLTNVLGFVGCAAIAGAVAFTDQHSRWMFSGGLMGLALAVAVVVWSSARAGSMLARPLSWGPLVYLGVISYGFYLWHWPLAVWLGRGAGAFTGPEVLSALLLTFGVASLSYHLLERPIRLGKWRWEDGRRGWATIVSVPVVLALAFALTTSKRDQAALASPRAPNPGLVQPAGFLFLSKASSAGSVTTVVRAGDPSDSRARVFLIGDSMVFNMVTEWQGTGITGFGLAASYYLGCGLTMDRVAVEGQVLPVNQESPCAEWNRLWQGNLSILRPDLSLAWLSTGQFNLDLVAADDSILRFGTPQYERRLTSILDETTTRLLAHSKRVAWVEMTCNHLDPSVPFAAQANDYARTKWTNKVLRAYVSKHHDVGLIPLAEWDCGANQATAWRNADERKFDGRHYTPGGALAAWQFLAPYVSSEARRSLAWSAS